MGTKPEALQESASDLYYAIGDRVKTLRTRKRMTLVDVGKVIGLGESAASQKLNGLKTWTAFEVIALAERLDVSVGVLYGTEPMPDPERPARITALDTSKKPKKRLSDYSGADSIAPVADLASFRASQKRVS